MMFMNTLSMFPWIISKEFMDSLRFSSILMAVFVSVISICIVSLIIVYFISCSFR